MDIDEGLAQRIRETLFDLAEFADISERKMFGGLVTMVNGHMTCGLSGRKDRQDGGIMPCGPNSCNGHGICQSNIKFAKQVRRWRGAWLGGGVELVVGGGSHALGPTVRDVCRSLDGEVVRVSRHR